MRCLQFDWRLRICFTVMFLSASHWSHSPVHMENDNTPLIVQGIPDNHSCRPLRYRAVNPERDGVIALASYPGSGNTWLRYLLQQATGIITGSIYLAPRLLANGFPGEEVTDASVLVVKTHEPWYPLHGIHGTDAKSKYNKVILLVRDPIEAMQAEFNRIVSGSQTEHAPEEMYEREWKRFVHNEATRWEHFNTYWFKSFPNPLTRHLIFYDDLVRNTQKQLETTLEFLNISITKEQMICVMTHKEGLLRRPKKKYKVNLFDDEIQETTNAVVERVYRLLKNNTNAPTPSSKCD